MSTQQPKHDETTRQIDTQTDVLVRQAQPLPPRDAFAAGEEAINRAMETREAVVEGRRRGRVEVESRRISEDVTRQAQERPRAQANAARATSAPSAPQTSNEEAPEAPGRTLPPMLPVQHLLVPLSGAPFAERALPFAKTVASLMGAAITLAHVESSPCPRVAELVGDVVDALTGRPEQTAPPDVATHLQALCTQMALEVPAIEIQTSHAASVASGLRELEERACTDLVVLATRPHLDRERRSLGTVAPALLRAGRTALLVIPPEAAIPEGWLPPLTHVLVPLDGSLLAEQALGPLVALVTGSGEQQQGPGHEHGDPREIVLFSVSETRSRLHDGRVYLAGVRRLLRRAVPHDVEIRTEVWLGSAPGAIVAMARQGLPAPYRECQAERAFDLVVMATHGRGGIGRWLFGSVAEYVLAHTDVPVLVVHPLVTEGL
jgi:nucleotide-binding universal stress UspA family protein